MNGEEEDFHTQTSVILQNPYKYDTFLKRASNLSDDNNSGRAYTIPIEQKSFVSTGDTHKAKTFAPSGNKKDSQKVVSSVQASEDQAKAQIAREHNRKKKKNDKSLLRGLGKDKKQRSKGNSSRSKKGVDKKGGQRRKAPTGNPKKSKQRRKKKTATGTRDVLNF